MGLQRPRRQAERPVVVAELGKDLGLCTLAATELRFETRVRIDVLRFGIQLEGPDPVVGSDV